MKAKNGFVIIIVVIVFFSVVLYFGNKNAAQTLKPTLKKSNSVSIGVIPSPAQKLEKCPTGFILVPGNALYGTSDFCVMKYDAKCASVSDLTKGMQPANGSVCAGEKGGIASGVYKNNGSGCACVGNKQLVSTASGFPVAYIPLADGSKNDAKTYCENQGWHVINNTEWMTIARNVEKQAQNWCDKDGSNCGFSPGTVGKILANGHNDNNNEISASASGHGALVSGSDDQSCFGTTTDGSNVCGGKSSQKRTLELSNGGVIWDFAGNVWHWVDATIARKDQPQSRTNGVLDHGWIWSDFTHGSLPSVIVDSGQAPALGYDAFRPSDPLWNATNGVGRIFHFSSAVDTDSTQYGFIRGGCWWHGYDSGAFCVHLSPRPFKQNIDDVGFRCVVNLK